MVLVPGTVVGSIIGRGGCEINACQDASGATISTAKENEVNSSDRCVTINGTVLQAHHAMLHILQTVQVAVSKPGKQPVIVTGGDVAVKILVPNHAVRFVIGKQGSIINELQKSADALISIQVGSSNAVYTSLVTFVYDCIATVSRSFICAYTATLERE